MQFEVWQKDETNNRTAQKNSVPQNSGLAGDWFTPNFHNKDNCGKTNYSCHIK
jgi:hypothetical protein